MGEFDEEPPRPRKTYPPSASKMSKTPSWVMLGFVLGALSVFALRDSELKAPPPSPPAKLVEIAKDIPPRDPPPLTRIEAVFNDWGRYAVWDDDVTEVALWEPTEERFSDFYEVRRIEGKLYFRTIPRLRRRVITHRQMPPECPLQFTETEEQYRQWRETIPPLQRMWQPAPPKVDAPVVPRPSLPASPEPARIFELPRESKGDESK